MCINAQLFLWTDVVGGENQVAIDLIVKHVNLKLQEVSRYT